MPRQTICDFSVKPGGKVSGRMQVPGDKSISHRALIIGAIAAGVTRIKGFLAGSDCISTRNALQAMGVGIEGDANSGELTVHGMGRQGLRAPTEALDLGNAGTAMRILCGVLAGQPFTSTLTGDESLRQRPMRRGFETLGQMGGRNESETG